MPDEGTKDRLGRKSWKRSWRSASPITKATLGFSAAAAMATVAYAVIAADQVLELRDATKAATQVEVGSHMPIVYPKMEPDWVIENGKPKIRIGMTLVNRGETPAVSPVFRWGWGIKPPDDSTHYQVNHQDAWSKSIWPKGVEAFDHQYISVGEAKSLAKGPLFVYGVAQYLDVFPKSELHPRIDHRVEFCVRVVRFTVSERNTSWGNEPSLAGSCVDDGCSDYPRDIYKPKPE